MANLRCTLAGTYMDKQYVVEVSGDTAYRFRKIRLKLRLQTGRLLHLISEQCGGRLDEQIVESAVAFAKAITASIPLPIAREKDCCTHIIHL